MNTLILSIWRQLRKLSNGGSGADAVGSRTPQPDESLAVLAPASVRRIDVAKFIVSRPLFFMLGLLVLEALLSAGTTYLVIQVGRHIASGYFTVTDLIWVFCAQAASYACGAASWIFAEQAGYRAFGRYMLQFAHFNRHETGLYGDKAVREQVEPFLTGEAFAVFFDLMYELEGDLKLLLGLLFNAVVLGAEIHAGLPIAYALVFSGVLTVQLLLRQPITNAYRETQSTKNRMTAHGYTAWDNVLVGNRYNLRLWLEGFKTRLRDALRAQIRAVVAREGVSATGGIIALAVVFGVMVFIAAREGYDIAMLIAMAATLPRQVEMTQEVNELASGWNELLEIWTRIGGVSDNMQLAADPAHDDRIDFQRLTLTDGKEILNVASVDDAVQAVTAKPTGRINLRGSNGAGKSTLLAALKARLKTKTYYWPTADRLAFQFGERRAGTPLEAAGTAQSKPGRRRKRDFSSGERQLRLIREIVEHTNAAIYLFDEWDANLDKKNRSAADQLINQLAERARVLEISHRDGGETATKP